MAHVCSVCGVEAVATCADCGNGFCWSHGDGLPAGTPGRLHATCATLAASHRANDARALARAVGHAAFVDARPDLVERVRLLWLVMGDDHDDDPRTRFRRLAEVVVVVDHREAAVPRDAESGLGIDADGHFWDLGPAAVAPLAPDRFAAIRSRVWRRRDGARTPNVLPPQRGLVGERRRSDELLTSTAGERELRAMRELAEGGPGPMLRS